jgi:hypothetical protein
VPLPIEPKPIITMGPSMAACTGQLVIQNNSERGEGRRKRLPPPRERFGRHALEDDK